MANVYNTVVNIDNKYSVSLSLDITISRDFCCQDDVRALREVVYDDTDLERERRSLQMALDIASRPAFCYPDSTMRREWVTLRNSLHLALCPSGSMSGRSHDEDSDRPAADAYLQEDGLPVWSDCCYEDVTPSVVDINVSPAEIDDRHSQKDQPRGDTNRQPKYTSVVRKEVQCAKGCAYLLEQQDENTRCHIERFSMQTEEGRKRVPVYGPCSNRDTQHTERHGEPGFQHEIRVDPICLPVRVAAVESGGYPRQKQTEKPEWQNSEKTQHLREEIDCTPTCYECRTRKRDFSVVPTMCHHECQHGALANVCLPHKDIVLGDNKTEVWCQPTENCSQRDQFNCETMMNKRHCAEDDFQRTERPRQHTDSAFEHAFSECNRSWSDEENGHDDQMNEPPGQRSRSDGPWTENNTGQIKQDSDLANHQHLPSNGANQLMTCQLERNVSASPVQRRSPLLCEDSESDPWKCDLPPCLAFHLRPQKNCSSTSSGSISVDGHLLEETHYRFVDNVHKSTTNYYPAEGNVAARIDAGHVRHPNSSTLTHGDRLQTDLPGQSNDIIGSFAQTDMRQPDSGPMHVTEESAPPGTLNNVRTNVDVQETNTGWLPRDSVNSIAEIATLKSNVENTAIEPQDGHEKRTCCPREDVNFVVKNTHHTLAHQSNTEEESWRMSAKGVCENEDETHPDIGQVGTIKSPAILHRIDSRRLPLISTDEDGEPMLPICLTDDAYRLFSEKDRPIADIEYAREDMDIGRGRSYQKYVPVVTSPISCPGASKLTETKYQHGMRVEYSQPELYCHTTNVNCPKASTDWSWLNAKYVRENIEYLYEETNRKQIKIDSSLIDPVQTRGENVENPRTGTKHGKKTTQCPTTYVGDVVSEREDPLTHEMSPSPHKTNGTARVDIGKGMFTEKGQRKSRLPHIQFFISERDVIQALPLPRADNTKTDNTSDQLNSQVHGIVNDCDCRNTDCHMCNQTHKAHVYINEEDSIECLVAPDHSYSPRLAAPPFPHRSQFPDSEATCRLHTNEQSRLETEDAVTSDDLWLPSCIVPLVENTGSVGIAGVECTGRGVLRARTDTCDSAHREDSSCVRDDGASRVVTALAGVSGVSVKRQRGETNKPHKEKPPKRPRRPTKKPRYTDVFHSYAKTALGSESALRTDGAVVDKNAPAPTLHGHHTAGTSSVAPPNGRVPHGYARQFKLRIRLFSGRRLRRAEARRRREEKYHNLIAHTPDSN